MSSEEVVCLKRKIEEQQKEIETLKAKVLKLKTKYKDEVISCSECSITKAKCSYYNITLRKINNEYFCQECHPFSSCFGCDKEFPDQELVEFEEDSFIDFCSSCFGNRYEIWKKYQEEKERDRLKFQAEINKIKEYDEKRSKGEIEIDPDFEDTLDYKLYKILGK